MLEEHFAPRLSRIDLLNDMTSHLGPPVALADIVRGGDDLGWLVLDSLHDATAVVDGAGVIMAVNVTWERFRTVNHGEATACGVGADYLGACATAAAAGCHEALLAYEGMRDVLAGARQFFEQEYPCPSPVEDRWFLQRMTPLRELGGVVVSHVDITRRKRAELELSHIASRDALTGLLNRRAIEGHPGIGPAVLFIDLDGFKAVNDQFGHATGDEVLARVASRILNQIRPEDRVARVGGDEFVVILEAGSEETSAAVASRIEDAVTESYQVGPDLVRIGASVGVAHGTPAETVADVIARADDAMYAVKRTREAARL
jgi:diguanylate cyclase (GGDEF)-like protein